MANSMRSGTALSEMRMLRRLGMRATISSGVQQELWAACNIVKTPFALGTRDRRSQRSASPTTHGTRTRLAPHNSHRITSPHRGRLTQPAHQGPILLATHHTTTSPWASRRAMMPRRRKKRPVVPVALLVLV